MPKLVNSWAATALLKLARLSVAEARSERFLKLITEVRGRITEISPTEAAAAARRGVVLIDVREKEEFRRGAIPGALHLPRGTIEQEIEKRAPDSTVEIIAYCARGNRSALVVENLQRMGYSNVKSLSGGLHAWLEAGLPASRDSHFIED